ncbi:MAG: YcaO-like family protein [Hyphomicrobiaceae bacterium]|nr:YcaO-like family protein [Hyphomicrobiaceae bacterium]
MSTGVIELREIDLSGDKHLEAVAVERHGAALLGASAFLTRLFQLSSPWAPGLCFVGAEATCPNVPGLAPISTRLHLAGGGLELADALGGCLGECVERLSLIEHDGDVVSTATHDNAGPLAPALHELIKGHADRLGASHDVPFDWIAGRCLHSDDLRLVPADWVLRRARPGPLFDAPTALSTGAAAARSFADAAARGLLELVERDAAAQWWLGGRRARPLTLEALSNGRVAEQVNQLRQGSRERATWLLDITTDLAIPVVAAVSVDAGDGRGFACGLASDLQLSDAAAKALLELCQIELGLQLSLMRHRERGGDRLSEEDRRVLARAAALDAARCELLHATGSPIRHAPAMTGADAESRLKTIAQAFAHHDIEAVLVDLTRPEFSVPVARALAPSLQLMPSRLDTSRLVAARSLHGGGERWTNGISLM